jgi:hypothetical protein
VAALVETARALQEGEPLQRPVYLLITDGEEAGLLGAAAFVERHALAREKPFVVNFDARGTTGPSLMYETHRGNLGTVRWMSRCLPAPCFTGSAFVTVYRYLPNDSDFSVFNRDGWTGLNFAFIGGAHRYHTAEDTLEHLDWRSVQHHGNNALAVAREVGCRSDVDLEASDQDAVFCDVLGLCIVYIPESWAWLLGAVASIVLCVSSVRQYRSNGGVKTWLRTWLVILVAAGLSVALGWGLARGLTAAWLLPRNHVAYGGWIVALYWLTALAILWLTARSLLRGVTMTGVWNSLWLLWSIGATLLAWWVPGLCYLLLIPTLVAAMLTCVPVGPTVRLLLSVTVAGVVLLPLGHLLPVALGPRAGAVLCPVCLLVFCPLLPALVAEACPADSGEHDR